MSKKKNSKRKYSRRGMRGKCSPAKHAYAKKLRKNMTNPEKELWKDLQQKKLGIWFYSQKIVYGYVADFWCPRCGIIVEVDGPCHLKRKAYDNKRDSLLAKKGILTMRFKSGAVMNNKAAVVAMIKAKVKQRLK